MYDNLLDILSIVISILIGVILGYLHTINEKMSEIKTTLAEIKVTFLLHKEVQQNEDRKK